MVFRGTVKIYPVLVLITLLVFIQPAYAYIDPGTGSMLFSVILCSVTTVFFLFNSLILKIKCKLFSKNTLSETTHKFVIYSEVKQYYCVFKPIADEFEARQIPVVLYTSSQDDPFFKENYKYVKVEFIGKGNTAYFKLAFLRADVCLLTTPQLDVLQLKRSRNVKHYSHILHSIGFSMDYKLFALDYYDSVLCDAEFQIPLIREIEQKRSLPAKELEVVGSTYMDYYAKKLPELKIQPSGYTVLVAPSWGPFSLLNRYGREILDKLSATDYNVIVRPHPQSLIVDKELVDNLMNKYRDCKNISWDFSSENIKTLAKADVMVSDFSCVMLDYAFLFNRPFVYVDTDINLEALDSVDLDKQPPWRYGIMEQLGRKFVPDRDKMENITEFINEVIRDENLKQKIKLAGDYAWEKRDFAAKNAVDFLVKIQQEVSEK